MKKVGIALASILVIAAFGYLMYMNDRMYNKMNALQKAWQDEINSKNAEGEDDEGNIVIGGQYVIRDTSAISDAYKSGDTAKLDEEQKETHDMAAEVIKACIKPEMTPYEKELAIYEWIVKNIKYDSGSFVAVVSDSTPKDTPYGALKSKKAVCVGFATTFHLFMRMLDIPCVVVPDTELAHSWNRVELDGEWYNVDCTFDSDGEANRYRNFNICDTVFLQDHMWDMEAYPEGKGTKYNYAVLHAAAMKNIYQLPKKMKECMDGKKPRLYVEMSSNISEEMVDVAVYGVQSRTMENAPVGYSIFPKDEKHCVLAVYFDVMPADQGGANAGDIAKMEKKLDKIFGEIQDDIGD